MTNIEDVWKNVSPGWRHLLKASTNVDNNVNHIYDSLRFIKKDCKSIVDWGPGGGFLSKYIANHFKTINKIDYVDIVDDHFNQVNDNLKDIDLVCGHKIDSSVFPEIESPDILIAYSVLYHMPSINYVKNVLSYWNNNLKPEYILIRNFFTEDDEWERDEWQYSVGNNFLRGNLIKIETLFKQLSDYDVLENSLLSQNSGDNQNCPRHYGSKIVMGRKK
tara:strand:+ start:1709 stop:2365 length:657 start_codon:yes stop_codon:yes gene_type:complete